MGESVESVAAAAGVPVERIGGFVAPIMAERAHAVGQALRASVRRRGETATHRRLHTAITEQLAPHGLDLDSIDWDAWRRPDRRWTLVAIYRSPEGDERRAGFIFDMQGNFSVAEDEEGSWLIGDSARPGDVVDDLALVHAVGGDVVEDTVPVHKRRAQDRATTGHATAENGPDAAADTPEAPVDADPDWEYTDPEVIRSQVEAELDQYDVVPAGRNELDVLYDMLGGIAEDSVNVYAGLGTDDGTPPVADDLPAEAADERPQWRPEPTGRKRADRSDQRDRDRQDSVGADSVGADRGTSGRADEPPTGAEPPPTRESPASGDPAPSRAARRRAARSTRSAAPKTAPSGETPTPRGESAAGSGSAEPAGSEAEQVPPVEDEMEHTNVAIHPAEVPDSPASGPDSAGSAEDPGAEAAAPAKPRARRTRKPKEPEPEQSTLTGDEPPRPARKSTGRKRAQVPSWDEIMFGSPQEKP